jgi:hypothetical protein
MAIAVYWNLHKDCFSIQSREKDTYGRVIHHVNSVVISLPKFVVRQAGREKVLKEGKKNVHAFVVGEFCASPYHLFTQGRRVTYNPYKYNSFVIADTKEPIYNGLLAVLQTKDNKPQMEVYYG